MSQATSTSQLKKNECGDRHDAHTTELNEDQDNELAKPRKIIRRAANRQTRDT
jgi:hypothetical protein